MMRMSTRTVKAGLAAAALAATLGLAGCSDDDMGGMSGMGSATPQATPPATASTSAAAQFNDADVMFVQMMVPHHRQAVEMSDMLLAKTGVDPDVAALAKEIKNAQQPEIDTMTGWAAAWGQPIEDGMGGMGGMDHGGGDDGMATAEEMEQFAKTDGETGQKMFLEMMTAHHKGAVAMAQTEIRDGQNPDAVQLAKDIVATQQTEITQMQDLLEKL